MATFSNYISVPGLLAGADLSSSQYKAVKAASTAGEVVVADSPATETQLLGLLQNDPADGEAADVAVLGVAKGICESTAIAYGEAVTTNSTGELQKTTSDNDHIIGIALEASSAVGDIIRVLVNPSWLGTQS